MMQFTGSRDAAAVFYFYGNQGSGELCGNGKDHREAAGVFSLFPSCPGNLEDPCYQTGGVGKQVSYVASCTGADLSRYVFPPVHPV